MYCISNTRLPLSYLNYISYKYKVYSSMGPVVNIIIFPNINFNSYFFDIFDN